MDSERKPPTPGDATAYDYERLPGRWDRARRGDADHRRRPGGAPLPVARRRKSVLREYVEAIAIAILLALVIRTLIVQAFTIPSGSMMDTLLVGDYILVNKFLYGPELPLTDYRLPALRLPHRGDIIVFKYPQDEKRDFIKRIVGTPGDTVQVRGQQVFINGEPIDEPYVRRNPNPARAHRHGAASAATPTRATRWSCRPTPTSSWATTGTTRRTPATGAS